MNIGFKHTKKHKADIDQHEANRYRADPHKTEAHKTEVHRTEAVHKIGLNKTKWRWSGFHKTDLQRTGQHRSDLHKLNPQLLCIIATAVLTLAAYLTSGSGAYLNADNSIARNNPGGAASVYKLNVQGIGEGDSTITVNVSARQYTEEEAYAAFEEIMESLSTYICGENADLSEVRKELKLKRSIPGYEGIRLSWFPENPSLISDTGRLDNYGLDEITQTSLTVVLRAGEYRREYVLPVTVYPADAAYADTDELKNRLTEAIDAADMAQAEAAKLTLPQEIAGVGVRYTEPKDRGWVKIPFLGIAALVLLRLKPEQDRRRQQKAREQELMADYSDIVSKLAIYIGAGMTAANAWIRICDNYIKAVEAGTDRRRAAYEEMLKTEVELKKGVPESKAYSDFAGRCSLSCYLKLTSLLEQNRRTGDARLRTALLTEAKEAFEQRKNTARQLGEEAGTKLMLPLILSLVTVMITVAFPAMMTLL